MDASVILINWNTAELTVNAINSVKQFFTREHEIIVVDNASEDDSVQKISTLFPDVRLIRNPANFGFARALNAGIRDASGRYIIALNSDTLSTQNALDTLLDFLDAHPEAAIVCPQLINQDGSLQNSFDSIPTLTTETLNKSLLRLLFPSRFPSKYRPIEEPIEVESCIGACMVMRKSALPGDKPLDEGFFFFLEETDLCFRMRKAGQKIFLVPQAKIIHLQGRSAGRIKIRSRIEYHRSLYRFFFKNYSMPYAALLPVFKTLRVFADMILNLLPNIVTLFLVASLRRKFAVHSAIFAWHLLLCPDSWGIRSVTETDFPGYKKIIAGNTVWLVLNRCEAGFAQDLPALLKNRTVMKQSRVKTLYKSEVSPSERFLIKTYRTASGYARYALETGNGILSAFAKVPVMTVKRIFAGTKSRAELRRILAAHRSGINTPLPIAVSSDTIIFPLIENAVNLEEFFGRGHANVPPETVNAVISACGRLARLMHKNGIYQDDFSPTNVIAVPVETGRYELMLVDFERAELYGKELPEELCTLNIAKLNRIRGVSNTGRLRFLKAYLSGDSYDEMRLRGLADAVQTEQKTLFFRDIAKIRSQCARTGRNYKRLDFDGFYGYLKKELPGLDYEEVEGLLAETCAKVSQGKPDFNLTDLAPLNRDGNGTYLFTAWYTDALDIWRNANVLAFAGMPSLIPVAVMMPQYFSKAGLIAILTETGMSPLKEVLGNGAAVRRDALKALGRVLGTFHKMGFKADGVEAGAVLVKKYGDRTAVFLPLMKHLALYRRLTPSFRGDDLLEFKKVFDDARLARTDRYKFMESYARKSGITIEERNELCRAMGII